MIGSYKQISPFSPDKERVIQTKNLNQQGLALLYMRKKVSKQTNTEVIKRNFTGCKRQERSSLF